MVSRLTSDWLGGDTTWIIAVGKPIPFDENYQASLAARSLTILNNEFYKERDDVRFGIVDETAWETIKVSLYMQSGQRVVVLKGGIVY